MDGGLFYLDDVGDIGAIYGRYIIRLMWRYVDDSLEIYGRSWGRDGRYMRFVENSYGRYIRAACDLLTMYKRNGRHADDEWTMYGRNIRNIWTTYDQYMGDAWTTSSPPTYRLARSRLRCGAGIPTHPPPGSPRDRVSD